MSAYAENLESQAQELIDAENAKQEAEKAAAASADAASSEWWVFLVLLSGWFGFGYVEGDTNKANKVVLNYKFFKVNPAVLDPIFGVAADSTWDTDQLLINSYIGCYVARNLSRDGVPY